MTIKDADYQKLEKFLLDPHLSSVIKLVILEGLLLIAIKQIKKDDAAFLGISEEGRLPHESGPNGLSWNDFTGAEGYDQCEWWEWYYSKHFGILEPIMNLASKSLERNECIDFENQIIDKLPYLESIINKVRS